MVLARVIEPTSKLNALRVLAEAGVAGPSYATVKRRLRVYAGLPAHGGPVVADEAGSGTEAGTSEAVVLPETASDVEPAVATAGVDATGGPFRARLARACAAHVGLGPATYLLYDVTTLWFETDAGDGFREPGFSKERRLEPQITVGLLTDAGGFPLMVHAFEGNRAETTTMVPVLRPFMHAHDLADVVVVADAGMISEANWRAIEAQGWGFILGAKTPEVPYVIDEWRRAHPGEDIPDGHVFTQPWPAAASDKRKDHTFFYTYSTDRARRTLHGIDQQIIKAEKAVAGKIPVKRNRFVRRAGGEVGHDVREPG